MGSSPRKIFLEVLDRKPVPRIPFWFMRQAGRYLPEYRELRAKAGGFLAMAMNPDMAAEITLQPVRRFGMDAAIVFSDILTVPHALGQKLEFLEGEGPKLEPVTAASIRKLNYAHFEEKLAPVYKTLARVRMMLAEEGFEETALIGFAGAPWTLACYMVEGGGSKDFFETRKLSTSDPESFSILIDLLVEATASYLIAQINAGAEAVQIFDSWAGIADAAAFKRWVIRPTRQITDIVRAAHPHIPIIGFPRGAGQNYLAYAQESGVNALGLDQHVSSKWAAQTLQQFLPVQGNLDPVYLLAGGDAMLLAAEQIISDLKAKPFIFNLGHGVHKDTPPEHVEMLAHFIRSH
jgi:uroporphyrinogen decarboxylase